MGTSPSAKPTVSLSMSPTDMPTTAQQNTDTPTVSPTKTPKPKCQDATGKFTITNKKGTKTSTVRCKGVSLKKCHWRDEDGQKFYKTCPVKCQSKITPKNLEKLWCEFDSPGELVL